MIRWKKYNGALIPDEPPHRSPTAEDLAAARKMGGYRFISYTTDFDCPYETPWWYVIKDDPVILENIPSSNTRYKIKKGLRFVSVRQIDPLEYGDAMYECYERAQSRYKAHEGHVSKEDFLRGLQEEGAEYYAAFFTENGRLVAYVKNVLFPQCVNMSVIKYDPEYLKYQVSAALTYTVLQDYLNSGRCKYVLDGQRAIRHKTNIQEYLEQYFGFRKAYCRLNLIYSPLMKVAVTVLYPFRKVLEKMAGEQILLNNIVSVLKMEEIAKQCRKLSKDHPH